MKNEIYFRGKVEDGSVTANILKKSLYRHVVSQLCEIIDRAIG